MIGEKVKQIPGILEEKSVDLWLTFVRETATMHDPALDLILGTSCTWQSAFMHTRGGRNIAIVGSLDEARIISTGIYGEVIGYVSSMREKLRDVIREVDPRVIAINTSRNDTMADGLTHGMYEILLEYLEKTEYPGRFTSSEQIISALRGRKSHEELERIAEAVRIAEEILELAGDYMKTGMSEQDVAGFILEEVARRGLETAWERETCPSVFTGPESAGAHAGPTEREIEGGHVLNFDFGVKYRDYCSDIQRTWYFPRPGEKEAPLQVIRAFETVRDAIREGAGMLRPGIEGWKVDDTARRFITSRGYDEYPHALGHQIGRSTHDGAGILCPRWERYGDLPYYPVEEGQVYTLEPRIVLEGYGVLTMEEIVVVEKDGCRFLSKPQERLYLA
jgi:Xaa-Pro aminopeptidase